MPRKSKTVVEYRSYDLPAHFPLVMVAGDDWRLSDVPSEVLHFHNCLEIGLCETDGSTVSFDGTRCHVRAGDVTVIAGDVLHTTWSDPGCSSKWSYLFVDPEELLRPFFSMDQVPNGQMLSSLLHGWYKVLSPEEYPRVSEGVRALLGEMTRKEMNYEISVRGMFLCLLTELMRIHVQQGDTTARSTMPIAPALEYINHHYTENFSIATLADACNMSESHFRRVFRDLMGIGPLEQLNHTRILKACSLLRMTEQSILSISELVGFRSLSSFNRQFFAAMGVSPTEWRRTAGHKASILKYNGWLTPPKTTK